MAAKTGDGGADRRRKPVLPGEAVGRPEARQGADENETETVATTGRWSMRQGVK